MSLHFQCIALLPSALPQFPQQQASGWPYGPSPGPGHDLIPTI